MDDLKAAFHLLARPRHLTAAMQEPLRQLEERWLDEAYDAEIIRGGGRGRYVLYWSGVASRAAREVVGL